MLQNRIKNKSTKQERLRTSLIMSIAQRAQNRCMNEFGEVLSLRPSLSLSFFPIPNIGAVRLNFLFVRLGSVVLIGEFVIVTPWFR